MRIGLTFDLAEEQQPGYDAPPDACAEFDTEERLAELALRAYRALERPDLGRARAAGAQSHRGPAPAGQRAAHSGPPGRHYRSGALPLEQQRQRRRAS